MRLKSLLKSSNGSATLQAAVGLPIFIGMLFMFQDAMVIGYNWISLQRAANEGIRRAVLGKSDESQSQSDFRTSIRTVVRGAAGAFAVQDGESFMTTESGIYKGDINSDSNIVVGPTAIFFGTDNLRPVYSIVITKTITVTPVTGVLLSMAGGANGAFTLTVKAHGRMERPCETDCSSEI